MQQAKLPFTEKGQLRIFKQSIDQSQLVWHRDREDRIIDPNRPTDWMIQYDNELPRNITRKLFIPKNVYHRLIKGSGDLHLMVVKLT